MPDTWRLCLRDLLRDDYLLTMTRFCIAIDHSKITRPSIPTTFGRTGGSYSNLGGQVLHNQRWPVVKKGLTNSLVPKLLGGQMPTLPTCFRRHFHQSNNLWLYSCPRLTTMMLGYLNRLDGDSITIKCVRRQHIVICITIELKTWK